MSTKSKTFESFLFSIGGVAAMFFLLVGVYIISHVASERVDLTQEKLYTLSPGTKAILKKLDTPVEIRFYSTQGKEMPVELKTYAQRVDDLLDEYQKAAGNKIRVKKFDPQPDSDAEDKATFDGVEGQQVQIGEKIYLGLAVSMLDSKEAVPFLDPRRERLLEYDITRAIANVMTPTKPVIGVMSGLQVFGEMNPMMMRMGGGRQDPWAVISELKRDFTVKEVQMSADKIDEDVKILLVIHPKGITDKTMFALDQFVLRGGKLIAFLDPHSIVDSRNTPGQNPLQAAASGGSSMDKLTKAWGIEYDMSKVVADNIFKTQISRGGPGSSEQAPAVLSLTDRAVNTNDVVTSQTDNMLMVFAGAFTGTPAEGLKETVLIHSSPQSQLVEKFMATFSGEQVMKDFTPSGKEYALAIRLNGKFKTAFPEGKPKDTAPPDKDKPESPDTTPALKESTKDTAVILVGDSDMIFDQFAAQVQNFMGQKLIMPVNQNLAFVQNMVEQMGGDENLIAVRSRASMNRPFTRVRDMQAKAEDRFRGRIKDLEKTLSDAQTKLNELQKAKEGNQKFILSPEQQAEIKRFQEKQAEVRKELKQERKNLAREIDSLENRLKWMNIAGMPFLVTLAGISLAFVKRNKTAAK
jgi:ABC-type uncharacterized transport system involved in gliding motility auxiliary subunit